MKAYSKIIAITFVLMMIAAPILVIGSSSDAKVNVDPNIEINSFDDMGGGSIVITLVDGEPNKTYHVKIMEEGDNSPCTEKDITTNADGRSEPTKLSWNFGSSGDKTIFIYIDEELVDGGIHIHSNHSIWKDPATYVAIVAVIILIIIAVYIKMRGIPGTKKDKKKEKTFTQIEAERLEKEKSGEKKSFFAKKSEENSSKVVDDTTSTEKQSYTPGKGFFRKKQ